MYKVHVRTVQVERRPTAVFSWLIIRKTEDAYFLYQSHAACPKAKIEIFSGGICRMILGNDLGLIFLIDSKCIVSHIFYHQKYHFLLELLSCICKGWSRGGGCSPRKHISLLGQCCSTPILCSTLCGTEIGTHAALDFTHCKSSSQWAFSWYWWAD